MNLSDIKNAKGSIYYGMHFYPGVAQYDSPDGKSTTIYLNESTLRKMDPTFAGRPVFVEHVNGVNSDVDKVRKDADGWVIESFFNSADGKHWVKFIIVSSDGEKAVRDGLRLSNAYIPKGSGPAGVWNGVSYQEEIPNGEFEHLALVSNPRYDESVIMTPEQFKQYNESQEQELKRIANSKEKENPMKLKFFKKTAVEKADDLETTAVVLPKSGKEMTIAQIVNAMDEAEEKKKENMADPEAKVKMHDGSMCNVSELVAAHKALHDELAAMKNPENGDDKEVALEDKPVDVEGDKKNEDGDGDKDDKKDNKEDGVDKAAADKKENELKAEKKKQFDALKNAHLKDKAKEEVYMNAKARVELGKQRYGSN